jgi:hypothetical protein
MDAEGPERQEKRTEVVSVAVTATEKRAVRAVASTLGITDSELLRLQTMDAVIDQYHRIRSVLDAGSPVTG